MLSFQYPQFLLAGLGLGIPLVLHLMKRQFALTLTFPSIRFIMQGRLPHTGRRRLRDILLLMLRLLLFALIVLALARPQWVSETSPAVVSKTGTETAVIVIDTSASMAGWQGLTGAKAIARELIQSREDTSFGLLLSADGVVGQVALAEQNTTLLSMLDKARPRPVAGNHLPALARAAEIVAEAGGGTVYIISDFQASDWTLSGAAAFPSNVEVLLEDVNPERTENVGITGASSQRLAEGAVRVVAELHNFGARAGRRRLELRAGDLIKTTDVTVAAGRTVKTAFMVDEPVTDRGALHLQEDEYPMDDHHVLWLGGLPPVTVLAVVPFKDEPEKQEELFYVRKALEVESEQAQRKVVVDEVDAQFFFSIDPSSQSALLLLGAAGYLRDPGFERMKQYLESGGTALLTPGKMAAHQFMGLQRHGLLHAQYRGIGGARTRYDAGTTIAAVAPESMLGQLFEDPYETDLFLFPIYKYVRLTAGQGSLPVLATEAGTPILMRQTVGKGRLYASAIGFTPEWSDFPLSSVFLPVVRELLTAGVTDDQAIQRITCGEPLLPTPSLAGTPSEEHAEISTDEPGVGTVAGQPYEINVSREESLPAKRSIVDIQATLTQGRSNAVTGDIGAATGTELRQGIHMLWPYAAYGAAVCLVIELLMATLLDRREQRYSAVGG